ncbi:MAG: DMT family transporter [Arenicellales bacterium]|nr:DMT family transporter [Arenicellales bacterium]MDP7220099.1 DMT family transporter [Arenicellales bacterium]
MNRHHFFALAAPVFWSISGVTVRLMESATDWQINFYRCASLAGFVAVVLLLRYKYRLFQIIRAAGIKGLGAGVLLSGAMLCNIVALIHTSVANAVLLMATGPIFAAVLGRFVLGERTSWRLWISIGLALTGIVVMVGGGIGRGSLYGDLIALVGVGFFGCYAVTLRLGKATDMSPAVLHAGLSGALAAGLIVLISGQGFSAPTTDIALCIMLGIFQVGIGSVLFAVAAQSVPAVNLTLYALGEPVLAPLWTFVGVGEIPATATFLGGSILFVALLFQVLTDSKSARSDT